MEKPYELFGIPADIFLEHGDLPDYATIFEFNGTDYPFDQPNALAPGDVRLWGHADYWTALEAAFLIAEILPNDPELYAVQHELVHDDGDEESVFKWKYANEFFRARDYFFLFERSDLNPKASPVEWIKYFNRKVRDVSLNLPFKREYGETWQKFFGEQLNEATSDLTEKPRSTDRAHVSEKLAFLNQAAERFWARADPEDRSTHTKNNDVVAWLLERGYSKTLADKAATIIRPDWAPTGRPAEE